MPTIPAVVPCQTITDLTNKFEPPTMAIEEKWRFIPVAGELLGFASSPWNASRLGNRPASLCPARLAARKVPHSQNPPI